MEKQLWTPSEDRNLAKMYRVNAGCAEIAEKLDRTVFAVRSRASRLGISRTYPLIALAQDKTLMRIMRYHSTKFNEAMDYIKEHYPHEDHQTIEALLLDGRLLGYLEGLI